MCKSAPDEGIPILAKILSYGTRGKASQMAPKEDVVSVLPKSAHCKGSIGWAVSFGHVIRSEEAIAEHLPKEDIRLKQDPCLPQSP